MNMINAVMIMEFTRYCNSSRLIMNKSNDSVSISPISMWAFNPFPYFTIDNDECYIKISSLRTLRQVG